MILITPTDKYERRTIWGPTDMSASLQLAGKWWKKSSWKLFLGKWMRTRSARIVNINSLRLNDAWPAGLASVLNKMNCWRRWEQMMLSTQTLVGLMTWFPAIILCYTKHCSGWLAGERGSGRLDSVDVPAGWPGWAALAGWPGEMILLVGQGRRLWLACWGRGLWLASLGLSRSGWLAGESGAGWLEEKALAGWLGRAALAGWPRLSLWLASWRKGLWMAGWAKKALAGWPGKMIWLAGQGKSLWLAGWGWGALAGWRTRLWLASQGSWSSWLAGEWGFAWLWVRSWFWSKAILGCLTRVIFGALLRFDNLCK